MHYYLAESKTKDVSFTKFNTDQEEINDFKDFSWSKIEDAIEKTKHKKKKEILMEAYRKIKQRNL